MTGNNKKIFKLIKFRTMTNGKDKERNFLPDEQRLNAYGKLLRITSLFKQPEQLNIAISNLLLVGIVR